MNKAYSVRCPFCGAEQGKRCKSIRSATKLSQPHKARVRQASIQHSLVKTREPDKPEYTPVEAPPERVYVVTIEYVARGVDPAEELRQAVDDLRVTGGAEVVGARLIGDTFDEACDILRSRRDERYVF